MMDNPYLMHYGILGMKWGIRRYQPYPKGSKKGKEVGEAAKKSQSQPKVPESKESYEKRKEKVLKSGTATEIMEFKGDLSNQQMETAIKRLDLENKLSNYDKVPEKTKKQKIDEAMQNLKKVNEWTNIGINTYNNFVRIYNSTKQGQKKKLTLVQGGGEGSGKKKKK